MGSNSFSKWRLKDHFLSRQRALRNLHHDDRMANCEFISLFQTLWHSCMQSFTVLPYELHCGASYGTLRHVNSELVRRSKAIRELLSWLHTVWQWNSYGAVRSLNAYSVTRICTLWNDKLDILREACPGITHIF